MRKGKTSSDFGRGGELSTIIGKGTNVKGSLTVRNSLRVDGKIKGDIAASDTIIIGKEGAVEGQVKAKHILMGGKVVGNIVASGKVFLETTASIDGDISALQLVVDEGAHFNGKCNMVDNDSNNKKKIFNNNVNRSE